MALVEIDVESYYRRYGPMVLRRCRKLLKDEDKAVDAMQDTFVRLLRSKADLRHGAPSSLLYRIATNVCLNHLRSARRKPADPGDELIDRLSDLTEPEQRLSARNLIGRLFAKEKETTVAIAAMHLLDGMTLEEVAGEVGMSVSGVRRRLRPLSAKLRELEGATP